MEFQRLLGYLEQKGLLSLQDLMTFACGEPIVGPWSMHPAAPKVFHLGVGLSRHPDVALAKLLSGRFTFVHRRLWNALFAVGAAREPWQMHGLSESAQALLRKTDREPQPGRDPSARELTGRLLVAVSDVGRHANGIESWPRWAARVGLQPGGMTAQQARAELEAAAAGIWLPWTR